MMSKVPQHIRQVVLHRIMYKGAHASGRDSIVTFHVCGFMGPLSRADARYQ